MSDYVMSNSDVLHAMIKLHAIKDHVADLQLMRSERCVHSDASPGARWLVPPEWNLTTKHDWKPA